MCHATPEDSNLVNGFLIRRAAFLTSSLWSEPYSARHRREKISMMDLLYLSLTAGLFALSWGLVRLCARL